jgi:hypothetical protein
MKRLLVIVPNYWGKGDSMALAFAEITKVSGSRKLTPRIVYEFDPEKTPECFVNEVGNMCWSGEMPLLIERKGFDK